MSDPIAKCDGCGALARRRPGFPCPDHWFFIESVAGSSGDVYVVWACSDVCREKVWKRGPSGGVRVEERGVGGQATARARARWRQADTSLPTEVAVYIRDAKGRWRELAIEPNRLWGDVEALARAPRAGAGIRERMRALLAEVGE